MKYFVRSIGNVLIWRVMTGVVLLLLIFFTAGSIVYVREARTAFSNIGTYINKEDVGVEDMMRLSFQESDEEFRVAEQQQKNALLHRLERLMVLDALFGYKEDRATSSPPTYLEELIVLDSLFQESGEGTRSRLEELIVLDAFTREDAISPLGKLIILESLFP